jgi:hypothetical protein
MGRKKLSMSEKIRRYILTNPTAKARDIATALGVKVSLVYAVKYAKPKKASPAVPKAKPVDIDAVHKKDVPHKTWSTLTVMTSDTPMLKADLVNHPPHYTAGGIETIDFLQAKLSREEFIGYLKGNVLKYGSRLGKKGDISVDAGKMAWYATKLKDTLSTAA